MNREIEEIEFFSLRESDLPEILEIYNHYILNTTVTWFKKEITSGQMREMLFFDDPRFESFGMRDQAGLIGYVVLGQYRKREAYNITSELSIYLKPGHLGKGIGSTGIRFLEEQARKRGFHSLLASISGDNRRSIGLFEKNGFTRCGQFREVGLKFGGLLDVVYYQKIL